MDVAVWGAIAKVAKKILEVLIGDKNGRKFLGYVVGIALFIVLLPVIVLLGLFGWMAGDGGASLINYDVIYSQMPSEYREMIEEHQDELNMIEVTFLEHGLTESDISKAKTIYISCLIGKESEEGFYQTYAECFINQTEEVDFLTNIEKSFSVSFTQEEREQFESIYSKSSTE